MTSAVTNVSIACAHTVSGAVLQGAAPRASAFGVEHRHLEGALSSLDLCLRCKHFTLSIEINKAWHVCYCRQAPYM